MLRKCAFLVALAATLVQGGKTPSGLYQDDGKGHTILTQKFSRKDVREISHDILNIMGFHHRPHPHIVDSASPASQFLLEVYNSLEHGDVNVDLSNGEHGKKSAWMRGRHRSNLTWSQFNVDQEEVSVISKADTITSFINRGHKYSTRLKNVTEEKQFWFDVSEVPTAEAVLGAELRLWKRTLAKGNKAEYDYESGETGEEISDEKEEVIRLGVHQVVENKTTKELELIELNEIMVATWEQGWLRINISEAFREWINKPDTNFGLVITTKSATSGTEMTLEQTGLATILNDEVHQPFVVSFLKDLGDDAARKPKNRVIRSAGGGQKERRGHKKTKKGRQFDFSEALDRPRSCQMGMLYVNFDDLGWKDWVIAPDGFIAYYCHGECSFPLTASMNATNHAIVLTLVHTYYPLEYPKPSCAPAKLGSISMLYYDDNSNVTVKKYKDMVIKSCGCK